MTAAFVAVAIACLLAGLVAVSYLVEALRSAASAYERLGRARNMPIRYLTVDEVRLRWATNGDGPGSGPAAHSHIQLDMFHKALPDLSKSFRVRAAGYPGRRSSALANILFGLNNVPVSGPTLTRLRQYPIIRRVLEGGVVRREVPSPALAPEMYLVGYCHGLHRAFMSLVRHWLDWKRARAEYPGMDRPALLIYGGHDWSRAKQRRGQPAGDPGRDDGRDRGRRAFRVAGRAG